MDSIQVEKRNMAVSARKLRRTGMIPCSVHGGQLEESISIQMTQKDAELVFKTLRVGSTLQLDLEGKKIPVLIKEKTRDAVSNRIQHFEFEALKADTEVHSVAHILLKNADMVQGQVEQLLYEVPFTSLPKDMVDTVTIDLEGKPVGTTITLGDISAFQNAGIKLKLEPDSMVLKIAEKVRVTDDETAE